MKVDLTIVGFVNFIRYVEKNFNKNNKNNKIGVNKYRNFNKTNKMKRKTSPSLNVRISSEAREMFDEIERKAHIRDSAITHAFVEALTEYWKKNGSIKLPFRITNDEEPEMHEFHANENGATAKITKKKP